MSGRNQNRGPAMGNLLNLERVPQLAPKFANQFGKTCTSYRVLFTPKGMTVEVASTISSDGRAFSLTKEGQPGVEWIALAEWERRRALKNTPSEGERLSALKRKYELRLNREFPTRQPSSGSEEDIQAWLGTLPFAQRRALLMSQKDFAKSYPEGFRDS